MRYHGEEALGLVETLAIVPVIEATDKMLKAADVELVALEAGGSTLCTVFVKGDVAASVRWKQVQRPPKKSAP